MILRYKTHFRIQGLLKTMKKSILLFVLTLLFTYNVFANSENYADKNTALRYLKLSQDYMLSSDWNSVLNYSEIGLSYDSSIPELWYTKALALEQKREKPYIIIENLEKALSLGWSTLNKNGAKLLLANYYYHTMNYYDALELVKDSALQLNSDALKIQAKVYYMINDPLSARKTIDAAWRIFPLDTDFPKIFFYFEETFNFHDESNILYANLKETFLSLIFDYSGIRNRFDSHLLLLASNFADEELQGQILKIYKTQGIESALYPIKALEANFITEPEALDLFFALCENKINYNYLEKLVSLISQENYKSVYSYLDSFSGDILFDNNKDEIFELSSSYKFGRPNYAEFEKYQDGQLYWTCEFDYGTPRKFFIPSENIYFTYARYPYVSKIESERVDFNLVPDAIKLVYIDVIDSDLFNGEYDFYIPFPKSDDNEYDNVLENTNALTLYFSEKGQYGEDKLRLLLSRGKIVSGNYYLDNVPYASAVFEDGKLIFRNVDKNYDGIFEIKEIYTSNDEIEYSNIEKTDLFGDFPYNDKIWLSSILVDMDADGNVDYSEEYTFDNKTIKNWNSVKETSTNEGELISVSFMNPQTNLIAKVDYELGKPVSLEYNNFTYPVIYDEELALYYIGNKLETDFDLQKVKEELKNKGTSYVVSIYENDSSKFCGIKTQNFYFVWNLK